MAAHVNFVGNLPNRDFVAAFTPRRAQACAVQRQRNMNRTNTKWMQMGALCMLLSAACGVDPASEGDAGAFADEDASAEAGADDANDASKADAPLAVPAACQKSGNPLVRQVRVGYDFELHSETLVKPSGLLKADFNGDRKSDYVFFEKVKGTAYAQLVVCLSKGASYQRKFTDLWVRTPANDPSAIGGGGHVFSIAAAANAGLRVTWRSWDLPSGDDADGPECSGIRTFAFNRTNAAFAVQSQSGTCLTQQPWTAPTMRWRVENQY